MQHSPLETREAPFESMVDLPKADPGVLILKVSSRSKQGVRGQGWFEFAKVHDNYVQHKQGTSILCTVFLLPLRTTV